MNTFVLAARNVRKSMKDYGVYFLTIVIGVAMFYVFNSVQSQGDMLNLTKNQTMSLLGLGWIMSYLTVFISAILGFLIVYANAFLVRRRKKELGIYMILGMKKGKISRVLVAETVLVGLVSLLVGLIVGVLASQGCALLTAKLYGASLKGFVFIFSASALWKSVIYFGIAFVVVMVFNTVNIRRQALVDLIYADKKVSQFRVPRFGLSVMLFVVSLMMLAAAYYLALSGQFFPMNGLSSVAMILGIVGTLLFFYTFSGFFLKLFSKARGVYFKGLNMFTLGQLNSKMNTAHISMSLVCLMLFIAISAVSVGSALTGSIQSDPSERGTAATVTYVTFYIGIVFILTCASVLAIAQLSETSDNRTRYRLLSELGAGEKMLTGSLCKQIALYFALPLLLAIVHSVVAIVLMSTFIAQVGNINILTTCLTSGLMIIALYGGYFLLTFFSARRIMIQRRGA